MRFAALCIAFVLAALPAPAPAQTHDPHGQTDIALEEDAPDAKEAKIVLVAGAASAGSKPKKHEYFAGCAILWDVLRRTPGVHPVLVRDGWPKNEKVFDNASAVVFYMDGGGKQPFVLDKAKAKVVEQIVDRGAGLVILHQAIDFPLGPSGDQAIAWLGGAYQPKVSNRGHWDAVHDNFPTHDITRGVTPFTLNDGFLVKMKWVEGAKGVTPLLYSNPKMKVIAKPTLDDCVAWAYERPATATAAAGRSFTYTGIDGHEAWALDGLTRFTVNGILWAAKVEVPEKGATIKFDRSFLSRHFDRKPAPKPPAAKPAPAKAKEDAKPEPAPAK